jgi:GntR family transcriptional regulator
MLIHISPNDGKPIYRQIVGQIQFLIGSGRLQPAEELPPIRTLAEELLINPNTVARAYRELEVGGWLCKRPGAGTYVSDRGSPLAESERMRILSERVDALLAEARQMDVPFKELKMLIKERETVLFQGDKS